MKSKSKHILLTGGTGLIGKHLTRELLKKGYQVSHLSRSPGSDPQVTTYLWDVAKGEIDPQCIEDVDIIVHLAGAGIADKKWTDERKKEIIDSRTKSIGLIYELLKGKKHKVKTIVSASATGYYSDRGDELMYETDAPSSDFMAKCCIDWEEAVDEGKELGLRIIKFRTGVVLSDGGALAKLAKPVKLFVGSPLGDGRQWISWIHYQDVLDMYLYGIENTKLEGVFNMVAPIPVTNEELTRSVAKQLHRPLLLPNVPAFFLKMLLGEMSTIVLGSTKVSADKIANAGYLFKYPEITSALKEIYG